MFPPIHGWRSCRQPGCGSGFRERVERLEPRAVLAAIAVTGTDDTVAAGGVVALREAITSADVNADGAAVGADGVDTIQFNGTG